MPIGGPRMSPRPRVAKYGVTHGCHPSRGSGNVRLWSSSDAPHRVGAPRMSPRPCDLSINTLMRTVVPTPRGEIRSSSPPRAEGRSLRCARFGGISRCCDAEHRTLRPAVETNDPRRGNSLPREGLQPCVAPYFADGCRRHAGTAAVHRENATPEAVAGRHRTTQKS